MDNIQQRLEGLTQGLYGGLSLTALPRANGIPPGGALYVDIDIQNTGDRPVLYVQGSGRFKTPQALFLDGGGLQPVLPADYLGPATMDYVTKQLDPGQVRQFALALRAVVPGDAFAAVSYDLWNREQLYIADLPWPQLQARLPGVQPAAAGRYTCAAYFTYALPLEADEPGVFLGPTAYLSAPFAVDVAG